MRAPDREALRTKLTFAQIESEVYYPTPLHLQPCFAALGYQAGALPIAEQAAREVLALPVHPDLEDAQLDHVIATIRSFYGS